MATNKQVAGGVGGLLAALLAALLALSGGGSSPPPTTRATTTTTTTTTSSSPTDPMPTDVRWFADEASWNRPAAELGRAPDRIQPFARRFWDHAGGDDRPGRIRTAFIEYSVPTYDASTATTRARVFQTHWSSTLFAFGVPPATVIPWNPSWKPGTGNDNILLIVDGARAWKVAGVGQGAWNCMQPGNLVAASTTPDVGEELCVSDTRITDDLAAGTDGVGVGKDRGNGMAKAALLTRAAEVRSGAIAHALEMTITATMFGAPACDPVDRAPVDVDSCGWFVPPGRQLERANPVIIDCQRGDSFTVEDRARTIPGGMRFALDISDDEITAWLDDRGYEGPLRRTARIFAVAMRDYGWIVAETGCFGAHIETDGLQNPATAAVWAELGIEPDGGRWPHVDLVDGLIDSVGPDRLWVVNSPDETAFAG